jgi:hypothetical protein
MAAWELSEMQRLLLMAAAAHNLRPGTPLAAGHTVDCQLRGGAGYGTRLGRAAHARTA